MASAITPIVGIVCNYNDEKPEHPSHRAGERYVAAVRELAGALPLLLPALGAADVGCLLDRLDGVILTGGASNVEPRHYDPGRPQVGEADPRRDELALPLVRAAVERGIPLFGICRGHQEINVAFGGTLHVELKDVPGRMNHRRKRELPFEESLAPRHWLDLTPGGLLEELVGGPRVQVNSLHGQGIDGIAERLVVEGVCDDGTIEAVRVDGAARFAVGVQWHAEWRAAETPLHAALFRRFGDAARDHASRSRAHDRSRRVA
jgi:putative glutamine amidotransferase